MLITMKCNECGREMECDWLNKYNWIKGRYGAYYCPNCIISLYEKLLHRLELSERKNNGK